MCLNLKFKLRSTGKEFNQRIHREAPEPREMSCLTWVMPDLGFPLSFYDDVSALAFTWAFLYCIEVWSSHVYIVIWKEGYIGGIRSPRNSCQLSSWSLPLSFSVGGYGSPPGTFIPWNPWNSACPRTLGRYLRFLLFFSIDLKVFWFLFVCFKKILRICTQVFVDLF